MKFSGMLDPELAFKFWLLRMQFLLIETQEQKQERKWSCLIPVQIHFLVPTWLGHALRGNSK